ncbi:MAG: VOC family protein [Pseudomonas sp.]|uniref:VOC family protein n=1 Tax=Pseudomonas sp. TaxID=306 RepID=UPI003BB67DAC
MPISASKIRSTIAAQCCVSSRSRAPLCRANQLLAIHLRRTDIAQAVAFFTDFGLSVIQQDEHVALLKGAGEHSASVIIEQGPDAYVGISLAVDTLADLQRLSTAHGLVLQPTSHGRGGQCVHLRDPDGLLVEAVYGYRELPSQPLPAAIAENRVASSPRVNLTVRLDTVNPCVINKLGHTVHGVSRMAESLAWYQNNFGLIVSDFQMLPNDPLPVVAFMRCDRGEQPADHHTLALAGALDIGHLHSAFEVDGIDAIASGNQYLQSQGHHHTWGIGRHILGSQLFDYWRDPAGDMFEHYSDGDLFDSDVSTGYHALHSKSLHQWGPPVNNDMAGKNPTLTRLRTLLRRLRSNDDLTFSRLLRLVRAAG